MNTSQESLSRKQVTAAVIVKDGKILVAQRGPQDKLANKGSSLFGVGD